MEILPANRHFGESWAMKLRVLLETIERVLPDGGTWCTLEKAHTLAALVVSLRPKTILEIGIWMGGSFVPMALALKALTEGDATPRKIIGVDPWSADASVQGQRGENQAWWSTVDHEAAYQHFMNRLGALELAGISEIHRMSSAVSPVPPAIQLAHIDGNHGEQVLTDVRRYAPAIDFGGFLYMDDIGWDGGAVGQALGELRGMGFVQLYTLDTGMVLQRVGR